MLKQPESGYLRVIRTGALWAAAAVWTISAAPAQNSGVPIGRPTADNLPGLGAGHGQEDDAPFGGTRQMQARQLKRLREEHQKEVVAASTRLVQLATALKAATDTGVTTMPSELKDVDEMAKLAKKVTERIKTQ